MEISFITDISYLFIYFSLFKVVYMQLKSFITNKYQKN